MNFYIVRLYHVHYVSYGWGFPCALRMFLAFQYNFYKLFFISECKLFSENRVKVKIIPDGPNGFYTSIAPIRMMAIKTSEETKSDHLKSILKLPDHVDERFNAAKSEWEMIDMEVVEFIRSRCFLKNQITEEELHHYSGIFTVNGVNIGSAKGSCFGKALYPVFSIINHDCYGNTKFKVDANTWEVQVKAQRQIQKGEEITIQYLSTILGTHKRRKRIKGMSEVVDVQNI